MNLKLKSFRRVYKFSTVAVTMLSVMYLLLLMFPQVLFAHSTTRGNFTIYSREPLGKEIDRVIEGAERRLRVSTLYDESVGRRVYLSGGFGMYAVLSHKAYRSFANSVPFINNMILNKADVAGDLVYVDRGRNNSRSLSGVIAHETAHLFIRERYGTINASLMPTWKNEGYCEYIAGDTTIPFEEGVRLWKEDPSDDSKYRFIKYQAMVRYLLEVEKLSVDELFTGSLDAKDIEARTFASLP